MRKAVTWLSQLLGKPILKLTEEDYLEHGMAELVTRQGPAFDINIQVFKDISHTITGAWSKQNLCSFAWLQSGFMGW